MLPLIVVVFSALCLGDSAKNASPFLALSAKFSNWKKEAKRYGKKWSSRASLIGLSEVSLLRKSMLHFPVPVKVKKAIQSSPRRDPIEHLSYHPLFI